MSFESSHARWQAVASRLRAADGHFVYAVKTTNIYCRPTCPARLARRTNVDFYRLARDAEAAGFRPCKRCKPENVGLEEDGQGEVVRRACDVLAGWAREGGGPIEGGGDGSKTDGKKMGLKELASEVGKTPRYLHKIFKDRMGVTPRQYAQQMEELYHPTTVSHSSDMRTTKTVVDQPEGVAGGSIFDFNDFDLDLDLGWDTCLDFTQADAQMPGQDIFSTLAKDASLSPDSVLNMPMTPPELYDAGLRPSNDGQSIANAQDLPALSPTALDGLLADSISSHPKYDNLSVHRSAPEGLAEWVWEAEWSNAVVDGYQRSAAVL